MKAVCDVVDGKVKALILVPENEVDQADLRTMLNRAANCWSLRPKWVEGLIDEMPAIKK